MSSFISSLLPSRLGKYSISPAPLLATTNHVLVAVWLILVTEHVRDPYLDEFFHVRQALTYYETNDFGIWDPKITTPPGLYLVSYLALRIARLANMLDTRFDALALLRCINGLALMGCYGVLNSLADYSRYTARGVPRGKFESALTAFNLALFPPLFFFSALFYTDVLSVLLVLVAHDAFWKKKRVRMALFSLASLWFRQTNVFWTGIYLGGMEVVRESSERRSNRESKELNQHADWARIVRSSWEDGMLYDAPVESAYLEDYIKMALSLVLTSVHNVDSLIAPLAPHLITLGAFGAFMLWNGGVVLGDKDNHIASIHLPQMLYIWAYMIFFSWPILLPSLMRSTISALPQSTTQHLPSFLASTSQPRANHTPRLLLFIPALVLTLLTVHLNTLIHPFTLADNRHYTFYVFKLFRQYPLLKYLLAPIYIFAAWACISALIPIPPPPPSPPSYTSSSLSHERLSQRKPSHPHISSTSTTSTRSSTLLLWLLTSTLSLATAPLVEPRYFILPWLIWRLNVSTMIPAQAQAQAQARQETRNPNNPPQSASLPSTTEATTTTTLQALVDALVSHLPLTLEGLWFLLINGATCWVFIHKDFTWDGHPGEKMRFMW